jgi:hypothetical protein
MPETTQNTSSDPTVKKCDATLDRCLRGGGCDYKLLRECTEYLFAPLGTLKK